jgi:ribosomal protein L29
MKNSELRERSVGDLKVLDSELARDLWKARFSNFTNQLDARRRSAVCAAKRRSSKPSSLRSRRQSRADHGRDDTRN